MVAEILDILGQLCGLVEVVAIDLDVHGVATHTSAGGGGDIVVGDFRMELEFLTNNLGDIEDGTLTLILLVRTDDHRNLVVHRRGEDRSNTGVIVGTGGGGDQFNLWDKFAETLFECSCCSHRLLDAGASLQLHSDGHTSVVLLLHKVGSDLTCDERQKGDDKESNEHEERDDLVIETSPEQT